MSTPSDNPGILGDSHLSEMIAMGFPERLAEKRKAAGLTQIELAERAEISVVQLRRYEAGKAQPTLDAIRHLAIALSTTTDSLIFEEDERGPGDDLRLQFEAMSHLTEEERAVARTVLESLIIRHDSTKWDRTRQPANG